MNILVTGGASGLGEAITRKLASNSSTVYFTYNKSAAKAKEIEETYNNTKGVKCDFSSASEVEALAERIQLLNIQALVNNATTGFNQNYFHKLKPEEFSDSFQLNILPVIRITQAAIINFRKQKFGKIITILSEAIINKPPIGWSEYSASKSYLLSLSKSWATENINFGISSNCISPSFMLTPLTSKTDDRIVTEMISKHPLKSLLKVEEVADTVSYFISASQQINGINLIINGGQNVI